MSDYFDELIGVTGNQYASKVSEGMLGSVNEYIDTGSYILNALISGSIHKGYRPIKSLLSQGKLLQVKPSFYWVLSNSFLQTILAVVFFILSLNLLLLPK